LELYYWREAQTIIKNQQKVFEHLIKVSESMLANNQAQQKDVVRAQLELSELTNRLYEATQQIDVQKAQLARFIGTDLAAQAHPAKLPNWQAPAALKDLEAKLTQHPIFKSDDATIRSAQSKLKLAQQQFVPGFTIGVAYGIRQGSNIDGSSRADFLTAQMNMDLPLFPKNRQSRTVKADRENLVAQHETKTSHFQELRATLQSFYARWQQLQKSVALYQKSLIPDSKHYAQATMTSYQNTQSDFPTLAEAYVRELDTELSGLRTAVDRAIVQANLLYLQGL